MMDFLGKTVNLCFSGGRTSAYMVEKCLKLQQQGVLRSHSFVITFANTGREDEETLVFVKKCSDRWSELYNNHVIWLEAVVHEGREASTHRFVNFETASRKGEPFEAVVAKYGLPNSRFLHCTRELKERPIISYMCSLGHSKGYTYQGNQVSATYETWIGIREDEPKRLGGNRDGRQLKSYPLAEAICEIDIAADKKDVLDFWSKMPFDLNIPEYLGNCVDCHKKSDKKLQQVYKAKGFKAFEFTHKLDKKYENVKAQKVEGELIPRRRFRGYRTTAELIANFKLNDYEDVSNCSSSCEPFMDSNEHEELTEIDCLDLMDAEERTA